MLEKSAPIAERHPLAGHGEQRFSHQDFLALPHGVLESYCARMSSNITLLRGLEPAATEQEIYAAALQYVRTVGGVSGLSSTTKVAVDKAVAAIAAATTQLLADLPDRPAAPPTEPPLRVAAREASAD